MYTDLNVHSVQAIAMKINKYAIKDQGYLHFKHQRKSGWYLDWKLRTTRLLFHCGEFVSLSVTSQIGCTARVILVFMSMPIKFCV